MCLPTAAQRDALSSAVAESAASCSRPTSSGPPKWSPLRNPCSEVCRWDSDPSSRDPYRRHHDGTQSRTSMRHGPRDQRRQASGRQPAPARREQRTLTASVFSGRSRHTARPHHRRSKPSSLSSVGEHFERSDHFANLRPICSHLQGRAIQRLLTAVTCAYSPARRHRLPPTATRNG